MKTKISRAHSALLCGISTAFAFLGLAFAGAGMQPEEAIVVGLFFILILTAIVPILYQK
ncbi:hypothetical protein BN8_05767 [Fibrisoma limi BUZ 3]|uniref:Uncharacterized protein n=1 Tax=Fibrisoma limi BUZ 3 TaxID=1185876 RepID=I2GRA3_9BACT|nr:hypothetical protein [Fibrisoma limi]CCH56431.1 hypothetical protein BN8_05767 [Fibrisoma limi BUZ 3]